MIQIKPVETDDELHRAGELLARNHFETPEEGFRWLETCGVNYPGFLPEHTRLAVQGNEIVGGLRLNTDTIRLGEARLKMGGIGWVTTAPHLRRRGICRLLMEDALDYMRRHKYHVSMLFGIPDLYHRWGFVTTLADYAVSMEADEAKTFDCSLLVRSVKPGDIAAIHRIHNGDDAVSSCSLVRLEGHLGSKWDLLGGFRVLTDDQGRVLAYFSASKGKGTLDVDEIGVSDFGLCAAVVGACGRIGHEEACGAVRFQCPPQHAMARYLLQFKSRHEMNIDRDASGMMSYIDVEETLQHMIPEWECCLARSAARAYRSEITLVVDGELYRIRTYRGAVDVSKNAGANKVSLRESELMHLMTGYRHPRDIIAGKRCLMTPESRGLLHAIFPKREPFVWPFDRF